MKRNVIIGSIVAVAALVIAIPALADHSWGGYHWARTSNPLPLELGNNVSSDWLAYLNEASADWNVSAVLDTVIKAGKTNNTKGRNTPKNCVATLGRVEVCNASYGANGWLGLAQIWLYSDGHIAQGTAKLNDTYFGTASYSSAAWKRLVMCQEVAHAFGLDHQDEGFGNANLGTCMDYTNAPAGGVVDGFDYGASNEHPNQHDHDQLAAIYAHLDSSNSYILTTDDGGSSGPGNGKGKNRGVAEIVASGDVTNASEWGRAVGTDGKGRDNLFVRNLGNGAKLITHVFWAE